MTLLNVDADDSNSKCSNKVQIDPKSEMFEID